MNYVKHDYCITVLLEECVQVECLSENVIIILTILGGGIILLRSDESYICGRNQILGIQKIHYKQNIDITNVLEQGLNTLKT